MRSLSDREIVEMYSNEPSGWWHMYCVHMCNSGFLHSAAIVSNCRFLCFNFLLFFCYLFSSIPLSVKRFKMTDEKWQPRLSLDDSSGKRYVDNFLAMFPFEELKTKNKRKNEIQEIVSDRIWIYELSYIQTSTRKMCKYNPIITACSLFKRTAATMLRPIQYTQ